jgi:Mg/Co/Ni transporter MgtE
MNRKRGAPIAIILGAVLAIAGFVTTTIYVFQPWRTCDYDDSLAACSMLPVDAAILTVAISAAVLGLILVAGGAFARYRNGGVNNWNRREGYSRAH